jgi:DNA-binding transcriptional LysR family regulator
VQVAEYPMPDLPALLEEGRLDVAFVRMPVDLPSSLRAHVLTRDAFCAALPAEHALAAASGPIRARALAGESFVVPEQGFGTREVGRRGRFVPRIVSAPGTLVAVLTQVSVGVGVAIVPNVLTRVVDLPNVVFKPLAGEPILSEVAAIFRKYEHSPATKKLIEQLTGTSR